MRAIVTGFPFVLLLSLSVSEAAVPGIRAIADRDREAVVHEAQALVARLGDPLYVQREAAGERLLQLGAPAMGPLQAALKDRNVEVRHRAERLLAILRRADLKTRLAAFERTGGRGEGAGLPGWKRYRELAGNTQASRALFVAMQQAEPDLLRIYEEDAADASAMLQTHCAYYEQMLNNLQEHQEKNLSTSSLATLLLLAGDPRIPISDQSDGHIYWLMWWRMYRERVVESLPPREKAVLVALFGGWIGRPTDPASPICFEKIRMALRYERKEVLPLSVELLREPDPVLQAFALVAIGALGDRTYLRHVEPLIANRQVFNRDRKIEIHVGDVALAVAVHLSGQELSDYGYRHIATSGAKLFTAGAQDTLYFNNRQQRDQALAKWKRWIARQRKNL